MLTLPPEGPPGNGAPTTDDARVPTTATRATCSSPPSPPPSTPDRTPKFVISLRAIHEPKVNARRIEGHDAHDAFAKALAYPVTNVVEPILTWSGQHDLVAVDIDRPDAAEGVTDAEVPTFFPEGKPRPVFAWRTHGSGLRAIFVSIGTESALSLAGGWYVTAPLGRLIAWKVELKSDTRHPYGLRDASTCGAVFPFVPSAKLVLRAEGGDVDEHEAEAWLQNHGLSFGRHAHVHCIWNPKTTSGTPPVLIDGHGIQCFYCNRRASWARLLGEGDDSIARLKGAARALVHLPHQRYVLLHDRPSTPARLVGPAWEKCLRSANEDRLNAASEEARKKWEARVANAASDEIPIVRTSSNAWFTADTLVPRSVSPDKTLKHLPFCHWPPLVDLASNPVELEGFTRLHVIGANEVVGPFVEPPANSVVVRRPRKDEDLPNVDVARRVTDSEVDDAFEILDAALPQLHRGYHCTLLLIGLASQRGVGTPPMVCVTGQSGSAKTAQVHLAAGALGVRASPLLLGANTDDTLRRVGTAIEEGAGLLFVDEVGRVDGLYGKLEPVLGANSEIRFRPKFANERHVRMRAGLVFLGSTLPETLVRSPELARRSVAFRLAGAEKSWTLTDPNTNERLDLGQARRIPVLQRALDTITTYVWWLFHDAGPGVDWRDLALRTFGGSELAKLDLLDDGATRTRAIRDLYEHFRTCSDHALSRDAGHAGWLPGEVREIVSFDPMADPSAHWPINYALSALVDLDADPRRLKAQASDLERLNLAPILGVSSPQLQLVIKKRGSRILAKFVQPMVLRGRGMPRTALPALDSDPPTTSPPEVRV